MEITIKVDNTDAVLHALEQQKEAALEAIGQQCLSHAKRNLTSSGKRKTGNLVNSLTREVRMSEDSVYVGTDLFYAPYIEYGTGAFGENSTGSGWWVYVEGGGKSSKVSGKRYDYATAKKIMAILRSKGLAAHMTQGQKPTHFLKNAVEGHKDEYESIAKKILSS